MLEWKTALDLTTLPYPDIETLSHEAREEKTTPEIRGPNARCLKASWEERQDIRTAVQVHPKAPSGIFTLMRRSMRLGR